MAGLANFLMAAGGQTGYQYDPNLTPEANAMAGAQPPAAPSQSFQRPTGIRNTVGQIADFLAILGGSTPMYSERLRQQEAQFDLQRKQNVMGDYLANPNDPAKAAEFARVAPVEYFKVIQELTPAPKNPGSVSDFQYVVRELQNQGVSPQEALTQARKILSTGPPALRTVPGVGLVDATDPGNPDVVVAAPPPAATQPSGADWQVVQTDQGLVRVNRVTGETAPLGLTAPPKTGGSSGLSPSDFGKAKARLLQLPSIRSTLASLEKMNPGLSGPLAGMLPGSLNADANSFDKVLGKLTQQIRGLVRVAGEGSISDYETRLANLQLPSRTDTPQGRATALRELRGLINETEAAYKSLLGPATVPAAAPAPGGFKVVGKRKQ